MSGCPGALLEAYARAELPSEQAAAVATHVTGCSGCAREVLWLQKEQQLFAQRARTGAPDPLRMLTLRRNIEAQLPASAPASSWTAWWARVPGTARAFVSATAALAAAFFLATVSTGADGGLTLVAAGSSCVSMETAAFCPPPSTPHELVAAVEDRFDACLVATPWLQPGGTDVCL